jgi:hypothetical protein
MSDFDSIRIETLKLFQLFKISQSWRTFQTTRMRKKTFFSTKKENILNKIEVFKDGASSFC